MEFETTGRSAVCETGPNGEKRPRQKNIYPPFFYSITARSPPFSSCVADETTKNDIGNQRTGEKVIFRGCLENITRAQGLGENHNVKTNETRLSQDTTTTDERTKASFKNSLRILYHFIEYCNFFLFLNEAC